MIATSSVAYVVVGVAVPMFGFLGLWIQARRLQSEVQSPNDMTSGDALYESRKMLIEVREQLAEVREAQLVGWERAHANAAGADRDRMRLESKVDEIVRVQADHLDRDEVRFGALFAAIELADPYTS